MVGPVAGVALAAVALLGPACLRPHQHAPDDSLYAAGKTPPGGTPTRTRPPPVAEDTGPTVPAPVARWAALTHELALALRSAGASCGEVAKTLRAFVAQSGAELGRVQLEVVRWENHSDEKTVDRFFARAFPDLDTRIDAGIRCKDDASARAAYDQFFAVVGLDTR